MDKAQRKQQQAQWRDAQRRAALAALPLSLEEFRALFDHLDAGLSEVKCDHSRRLAKAWLGARGHDPAVVFAWLDNHGGFCDCEILANAEDAVDEATKADD